MTPLAALILKDGVLNREAPESTRVYCRKLLEDVHCFDTTEIRESAWDLLQKCMHDPEPIVQVKDLLFLPAQKTWIETAIDDGGKNRVAFHLEEKGAGDAYFTSVNCIDGSSQFCPFGLINFATLKTVLDPNVGWGKVIGHHADWVRDTTQQARWLYVLLALINSPKILGRRQVMPQHSLERRLTAKFGRGKFPLHAWTEIKLHVAKPIEIDDGEPHEAHLTGRRALHFVRKHIRIRLGRLEYVSAHWRGDPAIGIKQSRYVVTT